MGSRRILELGALFLIGVTILGWRLHELQIEQHDFWEAEALRARTRSRTLSFKRGRILDREGREIAKSESSYDLVFRFDEFRKHSTVGRLVLADYLHEGERTTVASALRRPERLLDPLIEMTVEDYRRMQPLQRRKDLCVYVSWLVGREGSGPLIRHLLEAPDSDPFDPALEAHRERILDRVWQEWGYLRDLEEILEEPVGTLALRMDEEIAWIDEQVLKQLRSRDVRERTFQIERALHREYDGRRRTLVSEVPHGPFFHLEVEEKPVPGLGLHEVMRRTYPSENDVCPVLIGAVGHPWPDDLVASVERFQTYAALQVPSGDLTRAEIQLREGLRAQILQDDYRDGEETGRFGLEARYESVLRGRRGFEKIVADRNGRSKRVLERVLPVDGQDVTLTLDVEWQKAAVRALDQQPYLGAIVLLELPSQEIRILASRPERSRADLEQWGLQERPEDRGTRPGSVRAWRPYYPPPPGSVFKTMVAAMALSEGVVGPETRLLCNRDGLVANRRPVKCLGLHEEVEAHTALVKSCNHYFARVAAQVGYARMYRWAEVFGFGRATGFAELEPDRHRLNPPEAECPLDRDKRKMTDRNLMLFGFGQGAIDDVTPLTVAAAMGALACRSWTAPTILEQVGGRRPERVSHEVPITEGAWSTVVAAMREVTQDPFGTARPGTAEGLDLSGYDLATKTGTPQTGGKDHSWFAGFFPTDRPRYAFAVYLAETDLHGGDVCAPLFQRLLQDPAMKEVEAIATAGAE